MAIPRMSLKVVKFILDELEARKASEATWKILSLGYPDVLASRDYLADVFGKEVASRVEVHPNSDAIIRWHKVEQITDVIPESVSLFRLLNCELDIVDITKARGNEIIIDLNEALPDELVEKYDLVIDCGTLEHCFNIAQAIKNLAMMVKKDGYIMQINPLNWFNHGFYNFNPTFYHDFYNENGFKILWYTAVQDAVFDPKIAELPAYSRFNNIPEELTNNLIVKREEVRAIRWPIQTKYKKNSNLLG